jgi:hypothetical protein
MPERLERSQGPFPLPNLLAACLTGPKMSFETGDRLGGQQVFQVVLYAAGRNMGFLPASGVPGRTPPLDQTWPDLSDRSLLQHLFTEGSVGGQLG